MIQTMCAALLLTTLGPAALAPEDLDSPIAWDPDGRHIAYLVDRPDDPAARWQIAVTDTELETTRVIRRSAHPLGAPAWAPDGHKIAVLTVLPRNGSLVLQLQIITPQGRLEGGFATNPLVGPPPDPAWLTRQQPQWSPTRPQVTMPWWHQGQPGVTIMDTTTRKPVANIPRCVRPTWSTGGQYLFFRRSNRLADPVVAWDSGTRTVNPVWNQPVLTWRPGRIRDKRDLVVLHSDGKAARLSLTTPAGSAPKPVAKWSIDRELVEYVVSTDGRTAAVLFRSPQPQKGQPRMHIVPIDLGTRVPERAIPVLHTANATPPDRRPHALSIGPLGIQLAARYRLPTGKTTVALFNLRTGQHTLLQHKPQAMMGDVRKNLETCRRLTGQSSTEALLATPGIDKYVATTRDTCREVTRVANNGLNQIESQCRSYRPKDMPADLLPYAAQFHLFAGHCGQALRCLREIQRRDPALRDSPDFRLFQAKCFVLQHTYIDAVAAAKLMLSDPKLTAGQRQQAQTLLAMAKRRTQPIR